MAEDLRFDFPVPPRQLTEGGERLISPGLTDGATPQQARLPSIADMRNLSQAELFDVLEQYGVTEPWESMINDTRKYLQRVSSITPGSDRWNEELNNLITTESRRGMLNLARRTQERFSTLDAIDGNVNQEMMWVTVSDDNLCENCDARGGRIQSYAQWTQDGLPGSAVCLGGDQCRCELVLVD